eukprot:CAMPEP_0179436554 /NCGR_PEP_ID=MMETSP0799-20121207/20531_1 /TAXON_ID=46947 /ORGANISM="Geminigera cryophila, Strain CCMP2564" /LENGTH=348 /DNA_ID=CAMNT_0021216775 /DNA_START=165 /DNA_END=1211 /DNA_ORIENTATION=+
MHPSHERSRGAIFGLSCSGGIIITASDDDLEAELNRMKMDAGEADVDTSWRSDSLHKEWNLPLNGERIMFTTPRQYAGKLSSVLVDAGARPVWMPTVRYIPLPEEGLLTTQLDAALLELSSFDVIAFATKYSVLGFWERLTTLYGSPEGAQRVVSEAKVKFATVPALSALLRDKLSLCSDRIIAARHVGASDLYDVLACTSSGAAVLCVAPVFGDGFEDPKPLTQMLNKLSFRRLDVTRAPGYIVKPGSANEFQNELKWLRNGDVDVLGLTSALEVKGLDLMLDSWDGLVPDSTSVVGNGPDTALQAARLGYDRVKVLGKKEAMGEDFVLALAQHCSSRRGLQIYRDH